MRMCFIFDACLSDYGASLSILKKPLDCLVTYNCSYLFFINEKSACTYTGTIKIKRQLLQIFAHS